jgi:hypothetical protein
MMHEIVHHFLSESNIFPLFLGTFRLFDNTS